MKACSRIGYLILVLGIVGLILRRSIFGTGPVSIVLQVAACLLMIWARLTFGRRSFHASADPTEGGLVTAGPYKYVRHPIYAAVLLFGLAAVATHLTAINVALGIAMLTGVGLRVAAEERLVLERYPEYAEYAARTKRFVPGVL
jgi:protein-S-isoprenylcysteine O-methyltransferase Ste14